MYIEKKLLIAYLLWLFLGIFGGHKFYLRRPVMGVVYFCTLGLLLCGWLFDFFTLPDQVEECNYEEQERLDREMEQYTQDDIDDLLEEIDELKRMLAENDNRDELAQLKRRLARLESLLDEGPTAPA